MIAQWKSVGIRVRWQGTSLVDRLCVSHLPVSYARHNSQWNIFIWYYLYKRSVYRWSFCNFFWLIYLYLVCKNTLLCSVHFTLMYIVVQVVRHIKHLYRVLVGYLCWRFERSSTMWCIGEDRQWGGGDPRGSVPVHRGGIDFISGAQDCRHRGWHPPHHHWQWLCVGFITQHTTILQPPIKMNANITVWLPVLSTFNMKYFL